MQVTGQKVVDSVIMTALARVSMVLALPTIGLIFWLYTGWQDNKYDTLQFQINQAKQSAENASNTANNLKDRMTAVETKQVQEAASSERFQTLTLNRLDRMQESIVGLSNAVSALTATLQGVVDIQRKDEQPFRK